MSTEQKTVSKPYVTPKGVVDMDENGNVMIVSRYINLVRKTFNIDSGDFQSWLEFETPTGLRTIPVSPELYFWQENMRTLVNKGADVRKDNIQAVSLALQMRDQEMIEQNQITYEHTNLGFGVYNDTIIFKLFRCIGLNSTYVGAKDIQPSGNFNTYQKMLNQWVLNFVPLTFILTASLATVLLAYIGEGMDFENYIIHLTGQSSSGKTTAAMLAISAFANPDKRKDSLFKTYNMTANALLSSLSGLNGVPFAFDEISTSKLKSFTSTIYSISNGADKTRCNVYAEIEKTKTWRTIVFSTGEQSMLDRSNQNVGLRMRVFEYCIDKWTPNAEASQTIKQCVLENHGQLGFKFAKCIIKVDKEILMKKVQRKKEIMLKKMNMKNRVDEFTDRRCTFYGLILATKDILVEKLKLEIDSKALIDFLISTEMTSVNERNLSLKFIQYVNGFILENNIHFVEDNRNRRMTPGIMGWLKGVDDERTVILTVNTFKILVEQYGHESDTVMAKQLRKDGYIVTEDNTRQKGRKVVDGKRMNVYELRLCPPIVEIQE